MMRPAPLIRALTLSVLSAYCSPAIVSSRPLTTRELQAKLEDAIELGLGQRAGRYIRTIDPNERYEANFGVSFIQGLVNEGSFDVLFRVADEAFEAEFDRGGGATRGPQKASGIYQGDHSPPPLSPIHAGELGGLDGSSCRACHFSGGPDGSGSGSQITLLRGDGERLSSASRRDPPHLMGLGYISLAAREMQSQINQMREAVMSDARMMKRPATISLKVNNVHYGQLTAHPDGTLDTSRVQGISADLILRPFGWKGRHADLVTLCEEALQVHHGLQAQNRIDVYIDRPDHERYLGSGSRYDPDGDGMQVELGRGQGLGMAAYVSMIGAPVIKPPHSTRLAMKWAEGKRLFESVGCAECHRTDLRFSLAPLTFRRGEDAIEIDIKSGGQEPRLRSVDISPIEDGTIPSGAALLAFTDLKRHDMGPALAEADPERLPDGEGEVEGSQWLTRSLWGLADSAPYLHDGRAQTIEEAILWHGGEGTRSRESYERLAAQERAAVRVYLMSFTRAATLLVE